MLLVDFQIKEEIRQGNLKVTPFREENINPSSLDVRLGDMFGIPKAKGIYINPLDFLSFETQVEKKRQYLLNPKSFVISCLLEHITLPKDITAHLKGRSSLGRLGLENSSCAGHLDPYFSGFVTIELFNYSDYPIMLTPGMSIGQLNFFKHVACYKGYSEKESSKYMNQVPGQGSKGI